MKNALSSESLPIRFLTRLCDLMLLNLMFVFLSVTLVLSGAAFTALYSQTLKMVRREEDSVVKDYLFAVKKGFLPSVPATLLLGVDLLLLSVLGYALQAEELVFSPMVFVLLCILFLLLTAFLSWLFPLLARYDAPFGTQCKNALSLAVTQLPLSFMLLFVNLLPLMIGYRFPVAVGYLLGVWLLIGIAAGAYVNAWYLRRCFDAFDEE